MKIISLNASYGEIADELYDFVQSRIADTDVFCFQEMTDGITAEIIRDFLKPNFQIVSSSKKVEDDRYAQLICLKSEFKATDEVVIFREDDNLGIVNLTGIKHEDKDMIIVNVHGVPQPGEKLDDPRAG